MLPHDSLSLIDLLGGSRKAHVQVPSHRPLLSAASRLVLMCLLARAFATTQQRDLRLTVSAPELADLNGAAELERAWPSSSQRFFCLRGRLYRSADGIHLVPVCVVHHGQAAPQS